MDTEKVELAMFAAGAGEHANYMKNSHPYESVAYTVIRIEEI